MTITDTADQNIRQNALTDWLTYHLPAHHWQITAIQNDASFRRYFRIISSGKSEIAMDAPPDKMRLTPFLEIAKQLDALGLNAPKVYHYDLNMGFALLSDLGTQPFLSALTRQTADGLYADAFNALLKMQSQADTRRLAAYDATLLRFELSLFNDWFLQRHLHIQLSDAQHLILEQTFALLIQNALEQPQTFVHRDFHSRNLMLTPNNNPGILDFQDAVVGPITYDAVSLLRDCYIAWPAADVQRWLMAYYSQLKIIGLTTVPFSQFMRWFDLMGLQRHLKILGIFSRLNYRDNKPGYLKDIPRTYSYIKEVCGLYPELQSLSLLCETLQLEPRLKATSA